jgi:hypothetical protein
MMANDKQFLHAWIVEKLQESNENNFVGLPSINLLPLTISPVKCPI